MKFVTMFTKSGIARAMASALVLAVIASSTGLILADWGPNRHDLLVRVYDGDPALDNKVVGADLLLVADDRTNPDHGLRGTTDGAGNYLFHAYEGGYNLEIRHPSFNARDFHITIDGRVQIDAPLISLTTPPGNGNPDPNANCLPTPPRGRPMLNIWPISMSGNNCTDYPLLSAKNLSRSTGNVYGSTLSASENETVQVNLYVHNGTLDYPENVASNVMVSASVPNTKGSATIAAEAWAGNADRITSGQKGGNLTVSMGATEYLEYVPGSAKVYSNGPSLIGGFSDQVVSGGASVGNMRGCYEFLRWVTFEAKVKKQAVVTPTPTPTPNPTPTPTPTPTVDCPTPVGPVDGAHFGSTINDIVFTWNAAAGANRYILDISEDSNFSWHWNNGQAAGGGITGTTANFSNATNTFYSQGRPAPVIPVDGKTYYWRVYAYNLDNLALPGCHSAVRGFIIDNPPVTPPPPVNPPPVTPNPPPPVTPTPTPTPTIAFDKTVRNVSANQASFVKSTSAAFGEQVEFQLSVTTTGTVNNVLINDALPNRLAYVQNSLRLEGAAAGNDLTNVTVGTMTDGTKKVTFRATVAGEGEFAVGTTTLTNIATVHSSVGSKNSQADVVIVKQPPVTPPPPVTPNPPPPPPSGGSNPRLNIEKTVRNISVSSSSSFVETVDARADETVEFHIVISNNSNATVRDVELKDAMPSELTYVNGSLHVEGSQSSLNILSGYKELGDLARNKSFTVTFQAKANTVTSQKTITNTATARGSNAGSVDDTARVNLIPVKGGGGSNVDIDRSKSAYNETQRKDATKVTAKAGDVITYTLRVERKGNATKLDIEDDISDVLQLANLEFLGGGKLSANGKSIVWDNVEIGRNGFVEKKFTVRVKIPVPTGTDYVMTNFFGNEVKINVERPFVAPPTGVAGTLSFVLALISLSGYVLYRRYSASKMTLDLLP